MANNIVFSNSAEQLKSSVYGYDGTNYQPIKVNSNGELDINIGTIDQLNSITSGTIDKVNAMGTLAEITSISGGTITQLNSLVSGTIDKVNAMGTLAEVTSISGGTITQLNSLVSGTINQLNSITGGTINEVVKVSSITDGTIDVTLTDRGFYETTQNISSIPVSNTASTAFIDISGYSETAWYVRSLTAEGTRHTINVRIAVTPTTSEPQVLINETASLYKDIPQTIITNAYEMRLAKVYVQNPNATDTQSVRVIFKGRY